MSTHKAYEFLGDKKWVIGNINSMSEPSILLYQWIVTMHTTPPSCTEGKKKSALSFASHDSSSIFTVALPQRV
jgi:hypothetical protein